MGYLPLSVQGILDEVFPKSNLECEMRHDSKPEVFYFPRPTDIGVHGSLINNKVELFHPPLVTFQLT
jgi:hypothetical protein